MVYQIVKMKHRIFIETLILTVLILFTGFLIGFYVESSRTNELIDNYKNFEIEAMDLKLQNYYYQIMDSASCETAIEQNFIFADEIYNEGLIIERYEQLNELSEDILREKKRYVLLKTELWLNSILLREKCDASFHTVTYIYSQEGDDIKRAEQDVIADTLRELKEEKNNEIILIPIAGDIGLDIVDLQRRLYNITYLPSIIIDEKIVIEGYKSVEDLEEYLD